MRLSKLKKVTERYKKYYNIFHFTINFALRSVTLSTYKVRYTTKRADCETLLVVPIPTFLCMYAQGLFFTRRDCLKGGFVLGHIYVYLFSQDLLGFLFIVPT